MAIQSLNVLIPMEVTNGEKVILTILVHPLKAFAAMDSTRVGISTSVNPVHPLKRPTLIWVIFFGRSIFCNVMQLAKAYSPISVTVSGISNSARLVQFSNACAPMLVTVLGISIVSTPQGVMSDNEARKANVGGEILCQVF